METEGDRFELLERLGRGAFGEVFRASDRHLGGTVALKKLHDQGPQALSELKREFRALSEVSHPNLVELHELHTEGDAPFFTMEWVDGSTLPRWLEQTAPAKRELALRSLASQLIAAVTELHRCGILHRDLKPSNVLVDGSDGVHVTDFGMATRAEATRAGGFYGALHYTAFEELYGAGASEAGDWYAVGVILYEALTGSLPFTSEEQLAARRPPPPSLRALPAPWQAALTLLLSDDLAERARGAERLAEAGGEKPRGLPFVGRDAELALLEGFVRDAEDGAFKALVIAGPSGIGKSRLLRELRDRTGRHLLLGRCHPQEHLRYRALDGLVETLAATFPLPAALALDPALFRLFPALAPARPAEALAGSPREQQQRAVAALRDLLAHLAAPSPLLLVIDDVQWGDTDSALLLRALLLRPPAGIVLALLTRDAEAPFIAEALVGVEGVHHISLSPLDAGALTLLCDDTEERAALLADTGGEPFLLEEALLGPTAPTSDDERELLELVSSAGAPIEQRGLEHARDQPGHLQTSLGRLLKSRQLTLVLEGDRRLVLPYHDRVRERTLAALSPPRRLALHSRLADALSATQADALSVVRHLVAAERGQEAGALAVEAGDQAAETLAFSSAAELYQVALATSEPPRERWRLQRGLAEARANQGLGSEAARGYIAAAELAPTDALRLKLRAAEQYLRSGHVDEGRALLRAVFRATGMWLPPPGLPAILVFLWRRLRLRLRGMAITERPGPPDERSLLRLDALWTAFTTLSMVDHTQANAVGTQQLIEALNLGEPRWVLRALGSEASFEAALGGPAHREEAARLLERAQGMLADQSTTYERAWLANTDAVLRWFRCDWEGAIERHHQAEAAFARVPWGTTYERTLSAGWRLAAAAHLGRLDVLARELPACIADAEVRGDRYGINVFLVGQTNLHWLAMDQPELLRELAERTRPSWPTSGFATVQYHHLLSTTHADLYEGRYLEAHQRVEEAWPLAQRAGFLRLEWVGLELWFLRGRAALAAALHGHSKAHDILSRSLQAVRATELPVVGHWASLLEAGEADLAGDNAQWTSALQAAAVSAESHGAAAELASIRLRLGVNTPTDSDWFYTHNVQSPKRMAAIWLPQRVPDSDPSVSTPKSKA